MSIFIRYKYIALIDFYDVYVKMFVRCDTYFIRRNSVKIQYLLEITFGIYEHNYKNYHRFIIRKYNNSIFTQISYEKTTHKRMRRTLHRHRVFIVIKIFIVFRRDDRHCRIRSRCKAILARAETTRDQEMTRFVFRSTGNEVQVFPSWSNFVGNK